MLPKDMKHPREGRRWYDQLANALLFIGGIAFLAFGLGLAGATTAKEIGFVSGDPTWRAAMMSFFYVLCATECFTANITRYAGDLIRLLAEKLIGKSKDD